MGLGQNPVSEITSQSFTQKSYTFGVSKVAQTGSFRLCYCPNGAILFGRAVLCENPSDYIQDAGVVIVTGPNRAVQNMPVTAGIPFNIPLFGTYLSSAQG